MILGIFFSGCNETKSHFNLFTAPQRKTSQQICTDYLQAYYHKASTFKLKHIGRAVDACLLAQDYETAQSFLKFQDRYRESHPGEALQRPAWVEDQSRLLREKARPPRQTLPSTGTKPHVTQKVLAPE